MDFIQLQQAVSELAIKITGARVAKIHQPAADMLIFRLWNGSENLKLLLSTNAETCGLQLTEQSFPNPATPPRFCQLLRARVKRIEAVTILNQDRIVEFECQGSKGQHFLVAEFFGRSSNLYFLDSDRKLIDLLKRQGRQRLSLRDQYLLPETVPANKHGKGGVPEKITSERVVEKIYTDSSLPEKKVGLKENLSKILKKEIKKLNKRKLNIEEELSKQQNYESYKICGDLLLANLHRLKRGMSEAVVQNYYADSPENLAIPLDSKLEPQQNVDRYYKKFRKARKGIEHSTRRLKETDEELHWLAELTYQLESSDSAETLIVVAEELKSTGLLKDKASRLPRSNRQDKVNCKETISPNAFKVFWGTNSKQNDYLSTRMLKSGDLWFHALRIPGSHVLLKADSSRPESFSLEDIEFAASIAAANCKAKEDAKVEVMYATSKEVKKPPGARPGMVTVKGYKSLIVKPFKGDCLEK